MMHWAPATVLIILLYFAFHWEADNNKDEEDEVDQK